MANPKIHTFGELKLSNKEKRWIKKKLKIDFDSELLKLHGNLHVAWKCSRLFFLYSVENIFSVTMGRAAPEGRRPSGAVTQ